MKSREPWLLILPGFVVYGFFGLVPILLSVVLGFVDIGAYSEGWLGFTAVRAVFTSPRFWKAVGVTFKYAAVLLPLTTVTSVAIGIVLSWAPNKLQAIGRLAFYVPVTISAMMIVTAWRWILSPRGPLNALLGTDILWFGSNPWAFWSTTTVVFSMTFGGGLIFIMAAFAMVPPELYEAARLDGCNRVQEAWHITLPTIMPVFVFTTATRLVGLLQTWQAPYGLTGGGPNYGTTTILLLIYQEAVVKSNLAAASVMSVFLLVVVALLLVIARVVTGRKILT